MNDLTLWNQILLTYHNILDVKSLLKLSLYSFLTARELVSKSRDGASFKKKLVSRALPQHHHE